MLARCYSNTRKENPPFRHRGRHIQCLAGLLLMMSSLSISTFPILSVNTTVSEGLRRMDFSAHLCVVCIFHPCIVLLSLTDLIKDPGKSGSLLPNA